MRNSFIRKFFPIFLVLIICIPVILPYLKEGYFPTHDGEWAVVRLADMFRTIKDMQFPARFSGALNFGYGYPLFNFAYPFPYYLGLLFYFPTHSFVISIKSMFVLSVFLSAVFMYIAALKLWGDRTGAVISSVLYIYLPYRMVDLYVRGSLGESLSLALFPLLFYLVLKLFDSPYNRFVVVILSLSISTLVMTHNIMTVLFLPVLLVFFGFRIILEKRFDVLQSLFLALFLGLGTSSFFWFPALFEKGNILLSQVPIADRNIYFVSILQLVIPSWGYSPPTDAGGFTYQLGIGQLTIAILTLFFLTFSKFVRKVPLTPAKKYALILLSIFSVCLVLMFSFTSSLWKSLPLLSEINYPWTLISQLGFISSLLASFIFIQSKYMRYLCFALVAISFILVFPYANPLEYTNKGDNFYLTNEATTTSSKELMPVWVKEHPIKRYDNKVEVLNGTAQVSNLKFSSNYLRFNYKAEADTVFKINTIYYPGWRAYLNGDEAKITYDNKEGVMLVTGLKYRNTLSMYFTETLPRMGADIASLLSLLVLAFILLRPILLFKK